MPNKKKKTKKPTLCRRHNNLGAGSCAKSAGESGSAFSATAASGMHDAQNNGRRVEKGEWANHGAEGGVIMLKRFTIVEKKRDCKVKPRIGLCGEGRRGGGEPK